MAILTSLFAGVSGLNANGAALSVIGNNIANVNTVGFKSSSASFADVLSSSMGGASGGSQIGRGVFLSGVSPNFTQGSFESTSNGLDLGIDGSGFFLVNDSAGATFYSRAGEFNINKSGLLVNPEGLRLQGYQADSAGTVAGTIGDINAASTTAPPNATQTVRVVSNLDSRSTAMTTAPGFDLTDPVGTSHFSTAVTVYDSLGNGHLATVYFTKVAEAAGGNTWQWSTVAEGASGDAVMARGYLQFDNQGALSTESATPPSGFPTAFSDFDFPGGASQSQAITFDFGTSLANSGTGLDGTTQFGSTSATIFQSQDGYAAGALQSVGIGQDGSISGLFTNGQTRLLGQIVLGLFNNPQGLNRLGRNLFAESFDSGQPIVGAPDAAGRGRVLSSSLELSNVDLAEQFVKMITAQRGFQANSRVITTTDSILEELVNLKR
jgi:flagellar hook protein FlgE